MKKVFLLLTIATFLFSCEKDNIAIMNDSIIEYENSLPEDLKEENLSFPYRVSSTDADDYIEVLMPDAEILSKDFIIQDSDTLVFLYDLNPGWIAIAGDKRMSPIISRSAENRICLQDEREAGIYTYLLAIADEISTMRLADTSSVIVDEWRFNVPYRKRNSLKSDISSPKTKVVPEEYYWVLRYDYTSTEHDITNNEVPHLLQTEWGQSTPWNTKAPYGYNKDGNLCNCPLGCTAVAMAQVLYYMHFSVGKPSGLYHYVQCTGLSIDEHNYSIEFTRGNYTENSPRWAQMPLTKFGNNTDYVNDLMLDVGNRVGMVYSGTGSGAFPSNEAFSYYGLSCQKSDLAVGTIKENLRNDQPVIVVAYSEKNKHGVWPFKTTDYAGGHTWVIDGLSVNEIKTVRHYTWHYTDSYDESLDLIIYPEVEKEYYIPEVYEGMTYTEPTYSYTDYFLMNWGANGNGDNALYKALGNDWTIDGHTYRYHKTMYYNIQPLEQ